MNPESVIDLSREAIQVCMMIGGPLLAVSLVVGLLIGLTQAVTQVHDQSISTVPKILIVLMVVGLALPWFSEVMMDFSKDVFGTPMMAVSSSRNSTTDQAEESKVEFVVAPANQDVYYPELESAPVTQTSTQPSDQISVSNTTFTAVSTNSFPQTLGKRAQELKSNAEAVNESGTSFKLPQTSTTPEPDSNASENESPFTLPHYRFSRRPTEDIEG
jgi:flagellar biosynthetic protein FliQ